MRELQDYQLLAGFHIVNHTPSGTVTNPVDHVDVTFNEDVNTASFTLSDVLMTGPNGSISIQTLENMGQNVWRIGFSTQSSYGQYHCLIGQHITDANGVEMDQNGNGIGGEEPNDIYDASFTINYVKNPVQITFTKIADTSTPRPEGGTFTSFAGVSIDDGNVAFRNFIDNWNEGIYFWDNGTIETIAIGEYSTGTIIPGAYWWNYDHWEPSRFVRFGTPIINGGIVAFWGSNPYSIEIGGWTGIYIWDKNFINEVSDMDTQIPGSTQTFGVNGFRGGYDNYGDTVVFAGNTTFAPRWSGICTNEGGSLRVVADCNTNVPGGIGTFGDSFTDAGVSMDNNCIAFVLSYPSNTGIYAEDGGVLSVIANSNTEIPGLPGEHFTGIGTTCVDNGDIAFAGGTGTYTGIFALVDGRLHNLVDSLWGRPWGQFPEFSSFSFRGRKLAFKTWGTIYTNIGGTFTKVIGDGEMLDGKITSGISFCGASGNQIAFRADFTDGSSGIYVATVNDTGIPGDLNNDGTVNYTDLILMAEQWLQQDPQLLHQKSADIAEPADFIVNERDFAILAQHWFEGT